VLRLPIGDCDDVTLAAVVPTSHWVLAGIEPTTLPSPAGPPPTNATPVPLSNEMLGPPQRSRAAKLYTHNLTQLPYSAGDERLAVDRAPARTAPIYARPSFTWAER
jgi:hypothetical protein